MQKPNLDKMWETFIRIPTENSRINSDSIFDTIRFRIYPVIQRLKNDSILDWHCFLIHDRNSGVPTTQDDSNAYFHIRVSLKKNDGFDFPKVLPEYCVMTRKVERSWVQNISIDERGTGFDTSLLKREEIEELWRIIGEQSEWLMNMLDIYKEEVQIPLNYIAQFFHYYFNMTQLSVTCPNCRNVIRL
jgi:hypothetical protein